MKWQVSAAGPLPNDLSGKMLFLFRMLLNPWVISSFFCAFLASLSWMAAVSKFPINYAYPYMSLSFVIVLLLSQVFFHEQITLYKIIGMSLIVAGVVIGSQK
jgi:drug/metabolite transporter (DMT)-like permease